MINTTSFTFLSRIKRIRIKLYVCKNYQRTNIFSWQVQVLGRDW